MSQSSELAPPEIEAPNEVSHGFVSPKPKASPSKIDAIRAMKAAANGEGPPAAKAAKRPAWVKTVLHVIRRTHLYAGIFLLPWVFLYGVTGLLFNHPTWFSGTSITPFDAATLAGTPLAKAGTPADLAAEVVAAINARQSDGTTYTLVEPGKAAMGRGGLTASVTGADGKPYTVLVGLNGKGGSVRSGAQPGGAGAGARPQPGGEARKKGGGEEKAQEGERGEGRPRGEGGPGGRGGRGRGEGQGEGEARAEGTGGPTAEGGMARGDGGPRGGGGGRGGEGGGGGRGEGGPRGGGPGGLNNEPPAPFAVRGGVQLAASPLVAFEAALPTILERVGLAGATVNTARMASLSFLMTGADSKVWRVEYDAALGAITGRVREANEAAAELSFRRYLTRLHMVHGYPEEANVRSVWAVFVDAMSGMMIFWGVSGLVMWWQIKKTHKLGTATLVLSVCLAGWIGFEMYRSLTGA